MKNRSFRSASGRLVLWSTFVLSLLSLLLGSCKKGDKTEIPSDAITFSPLSIERGQVLTINGRDFDNTTKVLLNGKELAVSVINATKLEATISNEALDGKIVIKTGEKQKESEKSLHIFNYMVHYDWQDAPFRQLGYEVSFTYADKIYIAMGDVYEGEWKPNNKVYSYDPIAKSWKTEFSIDAASMAIRNFPFSVVKDNHWYVGCGSYGIGLETDTYVMDLTKSGADAWKKLANLPIEKNAEDALVAGNKVYAVSARGKKIYELIPPAASNDNKGEWISAADFNLGDFNTGHFIVDNKVYIGVTDLDGSFGLATFDPSNGTNPIVNKPPVNDGNNYGGRKFSYDNKGYTVGVDNNNKSYLYTYEVAGNKWTKRIALPDKGLSYNFGIVKDRIFMVYSDGVVYEYIAK